MKRPLFAVTILLVAVAWINLMLGGFDPPADSVCYPFGVSEENVPSGTKQTICLSGQICHKEETKIWLDSVTILNSDHLNHDFNEKISNQLGSNQENPNHMNIQMLSKYQGKIICEFEEAPEELPMGCQIVVTGAYYEYESASNPGEFDAFVYYRSIGVYGRMKNTKLLWHDTGRWPVREAAFRLRKVLAKRIRSYLPEETAQVMCALLLGEKTGMDKELKNLYKRNGILHILSISSLHITILGMTLYQLLRRLGVPIIPAALAGGLVLLFYGCMTGFGVSVCRSIGMYLLRMLAEILGRTYDMLTALGILALAMVLYHPYYLQNSGFLLSFTAVAGIGLIYPLLEKREKIVPRYFGESGFRIRLRRALLGFRNSIAANLAISLMTLPIQLWFYYEVPTCSLIINLLVLPFMKPLLITGFVSLLPGFGGIAILDRAILQGYEILCEFFDKLSFRTWNPGRPEIWQMVLYYLLLSGAVVILKRKALGFKQMPGKAGIRQNRIKYLVGLGSVGILLLVIGIRIPRSNGIVFLDVGQGDCALIRTVSGENYLIDCGSSSRQGVGEYLLLPCLKFYGIRRLDAVFLSHPDKDHMKGIEELYDLAGKNQIEISQLVLPAIAVDCRRKEFEKVLGQAGTGEGQPESNVRWLKAGDKWKCKAGYFECLHPEEGYSADNSNAYSLCIYGELGGVSFLFTGDVEGEGEQKLIDNLQSRSITDVTILKCAHHGSRSSTSGELLQQIRPVITVISCGRNNRYGHPHEETLMRLEETGAKVLRTDEAGAIRVLFGDGEVSVLKYGRRTH